MLNEIKSLVVKLRKTADVLDELCGIYKHNETPKTAKKLLKKVEKKKRKHWTQLPKNKNKVEKNIAAAIKAKQANKAAAGE